ncbi:DUF3618 domain-containing protein [Nonomuraea roseola]|uniref:DUF3618 domain-containing protein n=1 Tax=Nonomuraea roseola TaxID=46179 RepID=A0ABV5Q3V8_9ACTN
MTISGSHSTNSTQVGSPQGDDKADSAERLRADIAQMREDLGDIVEALAAKADVKARAKAGAKDKTEHVKANLAAHAHQAEAHVRTMATEVTTKAREIAAKDNTMPAVRRGAVATAAVATAGGGAVAVTAWLRRRNAARQTTWQRALRTARRSGVQVRHAATSPAATPGTRGAAAAAIGLLTFVWLRRRRARRHVEMG